MKSRSLHWHLTFAVAAMTLSAGALAQTHWGYDGEVAPQNWSKLDPKFVMCALGKNQSPIDITGFVEADLKPLKFAYAAGAQEIAIVNNGHTIQINYAPGSSLTADGVARASKAQIDLFAKTVGHPNNRPLNPVNARTVLK